MRSLSQTGSHVVAIAVLVAALGVVGFAGYKVWDRQHATVSSERTAAPSTITTSKDLDQTSQALDDSSADLDTNLDDSSLDTDLNGML